MPQRDACQQENRRWIAWARSLPRAMQQRIDGGDTNRVGGAMEHLARGASFPDVPALLTFLRTCDAQGACWFLLHGCATEALSEALAIATGHGRLEWLARLHPRGTWDVCPPLHDQCSRLTIGQT